MKTKNNIIFYFSGTGNGLQLAKDIADSLEECEVINIADCMDGAPVKARSIGFVFPVYFEGLPKIAHLFLKNLKIEGKPYLYCVASCGGASGVILKQTDHYLKKKGKKLHAGYSVIMPGNFIILYNSFGEEKEKELCSKARVMAGNISGNVRKRKITKYENVGSAAFQYLGYPLNKLFCTCVSNKDKNFHISEDCIGCGKCKKHCSVGNITLKNNKPVWNHHCELCMGCINGCPVKAINYKNITQKRRRYWNPNIEN